MNSSGQVESGKICEEYQESLSSAKLLDRGIQYLIVGANIILR
jgi:hypothetical protein